MEGNDSQLANRLVADDVLEAIIAKRWAWKDISIEQAPSLQDTLYLAQYYTYIVTLSEDGVTNVLVPLRRAAISGRPIHVTNFNDAAYYL